MPAGTGADKESPPSGGQGADEAGLVPGGTGADEENRAPGGTGTEDEEDTKHGGTGADKEDGPAPGGTGTKDKDPVGQVQTRRAHLLAAWVQRRVNRLLAAVDQAWRSRSSGTGTGVGSPPSGGCGTGCRVAVFMVNSFTESWSAAKAKESWVRSSIKVSGVKLLYCVRDVSN